VGDLLISRVAPGVARVSSVDPFDTLEIHRIDRAHWQQTPERPGIYLLYGTPQNSPRVYIGMSTSNMRSRIRSHHVNASRNWFGVLFAVPVDNPLLCRAIEAELIGAVREANAVDVIADNTAEERRHRNLDDVHVDPAVEKVRDGLQLLLGQDIFLTEVAEEGQLADPPLDRMTPLAREYRGQAATPRPRTEEDPRPATHSYVGAGVVGWGRFEADEPDTRFHVLQGTGWRRATLNPEATTYNNQLRLSEAQDTLVEAGVLDEGSMTFASDHVFENWTLATRTVSGKSSYSGGYHWQPLED